MCLLTWPNTWAQIARIIDNHTLSSEFTPDWQFKSGKETIKHDYHLHMKAWGWKCTNTCQQCIIHQVCAWMEALYCTHWYKIANFLWRGDHSFDNISAVVPLWNYSLADLHLFCFITINLVYNHHLGLHTQRKSWWTGDVKVKLYSWLVAVIICVFRGGTIGISLITNWLAHRLGLGNGQIEK